MIINDMLNIIKIISFIETESINIINLDVIL